MRIWLLRDSEQLPLNVHDKQLRMGRLAHTLAARGHNVTWWSSTFNHFQKKNLYSADQKIDVAQNLTLRLLECGEYKRNFSWERLRHHARLGKKFKKEAYKEDAPDVIVAAFPTIELAYEGARYAQEHNIPLIIDVRDMWPDSFKDYFPKWTAPLFKLGTRFLHTKTVFCFNQADSLIAISDYLLAWAFKKRNTRLAFMNMNRVFYLGSELPSSLNMSTLDEKPGFLKGRTVFTFIGSLGRAYDFKCLLKALPDMDDSNCPFVFVLAGEGEQKKKLQKQSQVSKNIHFLNWQNREESQKLLHVSDVIFVPCRFHAVPNKLCEGLAWGKPILASGPIGCEMQELLESSGAGLFFETGDHVTLQKHINTLSSCIDVRKKMGENAERLYKDVFQADRVSDTYAQHIEEVVTLKKEQRNYACGF